MKEISTRSLRSSARKSVGLRKGEFPSMTQEEEEELVVWMDAPKRIHDNTDQSSVKAEKLNENTNIFQNPNTKKKRKISKKLDEVLDLLKKKKQNQHPNESISFNSQETITSSTSCSEIKTSNSEKIMNKVSISDVNTSEDFLVLSDEYLTLMDQLESAAMQPQNTSETSQNQPKSDLKNTLNTSQIKTVYKPSTKTEPMIKPDKFHCINSDPDLLVLSDNDLAALAAMEMEAYSSVENKENTQNQSKPYSQTSQSPVFSSLGHPKPLLRQSTLPAQRTNSSLVSPTRSYPLQPQKKVDMSRFTQQTQEGNTRGITCLRLVVLSERSFPRQRIKAVHCVKIDPCLDLNKTGLNSFQPNNKMVPSSSTSRSVESDNVVLELSGEWFFCELEPGSIIHVVDLGKDDIENRTSQKDKMSSSFLSRDGKIVISDERGLLIQFPDVLVSPTKIAEACSCQRRSVLNDRYKAFGDTSQAAVLGNIRHHFIENLTSEILVMMDHPEANSWNQRKIHDHLIAHCVEKLIKSSKILYLEEAYTTGLTDQTIEQDLLSLLESTIKWVSLSRKGGPQVLAEPIRPPNPLLNPQRNRLREIVSTEEMLHCVVLGIKGQMDMILRCEEVLTHSTATKTLLPVELKTGKWRPSSVIAHRAQVILYILMLTIRERQLEDSPVKFDVRAEGCLVYADAKNTRIELVLPQWHEIKALICSRNALAAALHRASPSFSVNNSINNNNFSDNNSKNISIEGSSSAQAMLPRLLKSAFDCQHCYQAAECMTTHAALEEGNEGSSGVPLLYKHVLTGINSKHLQFLKLWDSLLDLEAIAESVGNKRVLKGSSWSYESGVLEKMGEKCLSNLQVKNIVVPNDSVLGKWLLVLERVKPSLGNPLVLSWVKESDRVILSIEPNKVNGERSVTGLEVGVCKGSVLRINPQEIHLELSERPSRLLIRQSDYNGWAIRLDADNISVNIPTMRSNLLSLMTQPFQVKKFQQEQQSQGKNISPPDDSTIYSRRWRELVIDLRKPNFTPFPLPPFPTNPLDSIIQLFIDPNIPTATYLDSLSYLQQALYEDENTKLEGKVMFPGGPIFYPGCEPWRLRSDFLALNLEQQEAVRRAVSVEDYGLLLGLPGTGKTSTTAVTIRVLIARGQKVLLTSYTHSAVDNLLLKLLNSGLSEDSVIRLGTSSYVHPETQRCMLGYNNNSKGLRIETIEELDKRCNNARLVACTVLSAARHPLMKSKLKFDFCVVDEAGQITIPAVLGALLKARKGLLVGDDRQLQPLVVSKEARVRGMEVSLFQTWRESHPEAVISLTTQYRMNANIMVFCNQLVYENKMRCGSNLLSSARIKIPNMGKVQRNSIPEWLFFSVLPDSAVVFLDTDTCPKEKCQIQSSTIIEDNKKMESMQSNNSEVRAIKDILWTFYSTGYNLQNVGVITPFRAQVYSLLEGMEDLKERDPQFRNCEISTVDKYQGRDKEVIIFSTVKNCHEPMENLGNIYKDWRRINVALTRARYKLIIIGSIKTMESVPMLSSLVEISKSKRWILPLIA